MTEYPQPETRARVDDPSRRTFLAATGVTILGAALADASSTVERPRVTESSAPTLTKLDLLVPPGEVYVGWHVRPTTAPLLSHLADRVDGLGIQDALVSGFIGRNGVHAPRYIETAAIPLETAAVTEHVTRGIDAWVASTHGPAVDRSIIDRGGVTWHAPDGGWTEVVRLEQVGDWLLLTSAGGQIQARLSPADAVAHYAHLLADRTE